MTHTRTRFAAIALFTLVLGMIFTSPAAAHTRLISSTPAEKATVAPLGEVTLVFSDEIQAARVLVRNAGGQEFQSGAARRAGPRVTQALTGPLPSGAYTLAYRVVGEDGHPIPDTLSFTVAEGDPAEPAPTAAGGGTPAPAPSAAPSASPVADAADSGGGAARWLMIGAGLLAGAGIGFAFVFMRGGKR